MNAETDASQSVIFDALAAGRQAGGPAAHARHLLEAWLEQHTEDRIVVVCDTHFATDLDRFTNVRFVRLPAKSVLGRVLGQWILVPCISLLNRRHAVVVSVPVLSPLLSARRKTLVFAHDWRHLTHPEEFSRGRRLYRAIWRSSVERADATCCISAKTLRETHECVPSASAYLCTNGVDHARRWAPLDEVATTVAAPELHIVAFGHRANKRPELSVSAFATATGLGIPSSRLTVLGTGDKVTAELTERARQLGVLEQCDFPGFVSERRYEELLLEASVVLMPSSDEGFGLPVGEALCLGREAVVTSDSGIEEVFGAEQLHVADPTTAGVGSALAHALRSVGGKRQPAHVPTWAGAVETVRGLLA